ncbi:MAG TPA: hypothetical protein VFK79_11460 [Xanthobacteraceae bacterium]|nr:hypothetical protein [Xanthobacteraceae bacterium]
MPFISGPSKDVVFGLAQDFAEAAVEIHKMQDADEPARQQTVAELRAEGAPTTLSELVDMAASTVTRHKMGWYRRNQFLGGLLGYCVLLGMPRPDAAYLADLIKAKVRAG